MAKQLLIRIWDVQHGSAAYVCTPENRHLAIDLGVGDTSGNLSTDKDHFSPLEYIRRVWGVSRLDTVVISHPHTDHVDDVFEFDNLKPGVLMRWSDKSGQNRVLSFECHERQPSTC